MAKTEEQYKAYKATQRDKYSIQQAAKEEAAKLRKAKRTLATWNRRNPNNKKQLSNYYTPAMAVVSEENKENDNSLVPTSVSDVVKKDNSFIPGSVPGVVVAPMSSKKKKELLAKEQEHDVRLDSAYQQSLAMIGKQSEKAQTILARDNKAVAQEAMDKNVAGVAAIDKNTKEQIGITFKHYTNAVERARDRKLAIEFAPSNDESDEEGLDMNKIRREEITEIPEEEE